MFSSFDEDTGQAMNDRSERRRPCHVPRAWPDPDAHRARLIAAHRQSAERPVLDRRTRGLVGRCRRTCLKKAATRPQHTRSSTFPTIKSFWARTARPIWDWPISTNILAVKAGDRSLRIWSLMVGGRLDNQMNFGNPPLVSGIRPSGLHQRQPRGTCDSIAPPTTSCLSDPGAFSAGADRRRQTDCLADWLEQKSALAERILGR